MKKKLFVFLTLFLLNISFCQASEYDDYSFQQERMLLSSDAVFVISSFDNQDHVTAYTYYGTRLWNTPFHAKILSWELANDVIFVFSKDRNGHKTYLTCLSASTGQLIWQRP